MYAVNVRHSDRKKDVFFMRRRECSEMETTSVVPPDLNSLLRLMGYFGYVQSCVLQFLRLNFRQYLT